MCICIYLLYSYNSDRMNSMKQKRPTSNDRTDVATQGRARTHTPPHLLLLYISMQIYAITSAYFRTDVHTK